MTEEAIDVILKLWSSDPPYEHEGEFWQFRIKESLDIENQVGFIHKPLQQPHPPIALPGINYNSYTLRLAGQRGFAPFSAAIPAGNMLADNWVTYEKASVDAGRSPSRSEWRVARQIFLADTTEEAVNRVRTNSAGRNFEYLASLMDAGPGRGWLKRDSEMADADCTMDYWLTEQIIAGDVDHVLERLLALREEVGRFGTLILMCFDWDDKDCWLRNLELFANELMPALNNAVAESRA